jgi:signal transduction histidine kinase
MRPKLPFWIELAGALVLALVVSNVITFFVLAVDRDQAVRAERLRLFEERLVGLVEEASARPDYIGPVGPRRFHRRERIEIAAEPSAPQTDTLPTLHRRFARTLGELGVTEVRLIGHWRGGAPPQLRRDLPEAEPVPRRGGDPPAPGGDRRRIERLDVSARLADGRWINASFLMPRPPPASRLPPVLPAIASLAAIIAVAIWMSLRLARPLDALSGAAAAMRSGEAAPPVPEQGPMPVRRAAAAFNAMSRQVNATLASQRALLAGLAHDLRTPITALRLRTEFVQDQETRSRMQASLDELQALTEAALEAARAGGDGEQARQMDLAALVQSVCEDLADLDMPVQVEADRPAPCAIRPNAVRRAVRNLVENAVKHGAVARVTVSPGAPHAVIVDDDGPGIAEGDLDRVFDPFVRLDPSRSADTGGHGLGLTIARMVARSHGGDVRLANRPGGGLRATLTLPAQPRG